MPSPKLTFLKMVISQPQSPNARKNSKFVFLIFYFEYLCYTVTYRKIICSQSSQKYFFFKIFPNNFSSKIFFIFSKNFSSLFQNDKKFSQHFYSSFYRNFSFFQNCDFLIFFSSLFSKNQYNTQKCGQKVSIFRRNA